MASSPRSSFSFVYENQRRNLDDPRTYSAALLQGSEKSWSSDDIKVMRPRPGNLSLPRGYVWAEDSVWQVGPWLYRDNGNVRRRKHTKERVLDVPDDIIDAGDDEHQPPSDQADSSTSTSTSTLSSSSMSSSPRRASRKESWIGRSFATFFQRSLSSLSLQSSDPHLLEKSILRYRMVLWLSIQQRPHADDLSAACDDALDQYAANKSLALLIDSFSDYTQAFIDTPQRLVSLRDFLTGLVADGPGAPVDEVTSASAMLDTLGPLCDKSAPIKGFPRVEFEEFVLPEVTAEAKVRVYGDVLCRIESNRLRSICPLEFMWLSKVKEKDPPLTVNLRLIGSNERMSLKFSNKPSFDGFIRVLRSKIAERLKSIGAASDSGGRKIRFRTHEGLVYDGETKQGVFHGVGKLQADDESYSGEWRRGKRHGQGETKTKDWLIKGHFKDDLLDGEAVQFYTIPEGAGVNAPLKFQGTWRLGQRQGHGILDMVGGDKISANWVGERPLDPVTHTTSDGEHFVGGWSAAGKREGYGVLTTPNYRYYGIFKAGARAGLGHCVQLKHPKLWFKGMWASDSLKGECSMQIPSVGILSGTVSSGDQSVDGEINFTSGKLILGEPPLSISDTRWLAFVQTQFTSLNTGAFKTSLENLEGQLGETNDRDEQVLQTILCASVSSAYSLLVDHYSSLASSCFAAKHGKASKMLDLNISDLHQFATALAKHMWLRMHEGHPDSKKFASICRSSAYRALFHYRKGLFNQIWERGLQINAKKDSELQAAYVRFEKMDSQQQLLCVFPKESPEKLIKETEQMREHDKQLQQMVQLKTAHEKLSCVVSWVDELSELLRHSSFGADELIPVLCYALLMSKIPNLATEMWFIQKFFSPNVHAGRAEYLLTTACGAVDVLPQLVENKEPT